LGACARCIQTQLGMRNVWSASPRCAPKCLVIGADKPKCLVIGADKPKCLVIGADKPKCLVIGADKASVLSNRALVQNTCFHKLPATHHPCHVLLA